MKKIATYINKVAKSFLIDGSDIKGKMQAYIKNQEEGQKKSLEYYLRDAKEELEWTRSEAEKFINKVDAVKKMIAKNIVDYVRISDLNFETTSNWWTFTVNIPIEKIKAKTADKLAQEFKNMKVEAYVHNGDFHIGFTYQKYAKRQ